MWRSRFPSLWIRLSVIVIGLGLTETFGRWSDGDYETEKLARLGQFANAAEESFGYQMDAVATGKHLILDFDRIRYELDLLGFDCTEVHR